jgi:predicted CoA-binding protein
VALAVIEDLHQNLEIMNVYAPTEELYEVAKDWFY